MKKIFALILALLMIVSVFTACDGEIIIIGGESDIEYDFTVKPTGKQTEKQTEKNTEKQSEKNTEKQSEKKTDKEIFTQVIPEEDLDFDGEKISILVRDTRNCQREWYKDVTEDVLDEVIAMRNESVGQVLNIEAQYALVASSLYDDCLDIFTRLIRDDVDGDFHYYDIAANYAYAGASSAVRDYITNLADKETFPYFEFSLPCWNQSIVDNLTVNGQLYYVTGDLNLSTFDRTVAIFLNKTMYDRKKTVDDPEDLQDVAIDGDWDYELLYRWSSVFEETNNKNGDQHDDFHAISSPFSSIPVDAFSSAWDLEFITEKSDGSHAYNIVGNSKIENAVTDLQALLDETKAAGVCNSDDTMNCTLGGYTESITHVACDKSIFAIHFLYGTEDDNVNIREMYSGFGILPLPKYDAAEQENYSTTAHDSYTLMTVIDHGCSSVPTKGEAISAYLQYSYEESYINIRYYYIDRIVKPKYFGINDTNDSVAKSRKIFDMIADNIEFSFASVYAPQLNGVLSQCWRDVVTGRHDTGATTPEDAFLSDESTYVSALENVDKWLGVRR